MAIAAKERACILVADEHTLTREAMCLLLARMLPDAMVLQISHADEGAAFGFACPSVVLYCVRPPYLKSLATLLELRRHFPGAPVVLLSEVLDVKLSFMARARGASGLFHTSGEPADLLEAIRQALEGKSGFPPERRKVGPPADYRFSPRQVEVLNLLCKGKSNKEIGALLHMSGNTVRTHVAAIFNILGVRNRTEAVIFGRYLT